MNQPAQPDLVTFVTRAAKHRWNDIDTMRSVDDAPARYRSGVDVWTIQTYLELRQIQEQLGFRVTLSDRFPPGMPAVAHRDDLRVAYAYFRSYLGVTRADRNRSHVAAWHVVQNPLQALADAVFIPLWPQPGLRPRDIGRRERRTIGFFGRLDSLPGFFHDPVFGAELARRGMVLEIHDREWHDYSATDLCIAIRYDPEIGLSNKPPSKLTNAWLAGVPALLGPEPAFQALRRSALDYLEVRNGRDVLAAVERLQVTPGLYEAMVENARMRSGDYTREAIRQRWIEFLINNFLPGWHGWQKSRPAPFSRYLHIARQLRAQRVEGRAYKRVESEQRRIIAERGLGSTLDVP